MKIPGFSDLLLLFLFSFLFSCSPVVDHEIILEEDGMIMINAARKMNPEELKELARYNFDEYQHDNFLMMKVYIPSKYPDYPETPWAQVVIDGMNVAGDEPLTTVEIYGTLDDQEQQALIDIQPGMSGIKGKWYWHEPMMEGVYFLVENETDTAIYGYRANGYYETFQEGWDDSPAIRTSRWENPGPHTDFRLTAGPGRNQYCLLPDTVTPYFWITEHNELILNRIKTGKDTSKCVMLPLPMK